MLDASSKAIRFTYGKTRTELDTDEQLALALTRLVEIIGEAASKISEDLRARTPTIPWNNIIGTRNRLVHAYESVDYEILWTIISKELPDLLKQLQELIQREQNQQSLF
jgi:uncharacterized protein with HEPN domain